MAKVTSKLQVTVPKVIAQRYGIRPGDDIEWVAAGDAIRVIRAGKKLLSDDLDAKLRLFDQATERHKRRPLGRTKRVREKGWKREDLYERGRSR